MCVLCLANVKLMCLSMRAENEMKEMNVKEELALEQVLPIKTCKLPMFLTAAKVFPALL